MTLPQAFQGLQDTRQGNAKRHLFLEILTIALCATIAGADSFEDMPRWAKAQRHWLERFLLLPAGIPSPDTFRRLFLAIDPKAFRESFLLWTKDLFVPQEEEVLAIDGKTLKASADERRDLPALHLVSAWATKSRLVLAQEPVAHKENEIGAIPKILELLDLSGCILTIDAMGCQKQIAQQILAGGGHYLLALKANHELLFDRVRDLFESERAREFTTSYGDQIAHCLAKSVDKGHGRLEIRRCWMIDEAQYLDVADSAGNCFGFGSVVCIQSERHVGEQVSFQERYYISTLPGHSSADAARALRASRHHWGIENRLHWVLDVCFGEDRCRVREVRARENLAGLRHVALNLLSRAKSIPGGVSARRKLAAWNPEYLLQIITA